MIKFNNEKEIPNTFFGGSEQKRAYEIDGKIYMVKFPDPVRQKKNELSYMNNQFSEYILSRASGGDPDIAKIFPAVIPSPYFSGIYDGRASFHTCRGAWSLIAAKILSHAIQSCGRKAKAGLEKRPPSRQRIRFLDGERFLMSFVRALGSGWRGGRGRWHEGRV